MLHILSILRLSLRMRIARPLSTSSNFCHQKAGQCSEPSSDINIQSAGRDVEAEVRVRFAPSPTGYLHLGGLRTALYNYLFARAKNGVFTLRIEDTDQSRLVEGATEQLCRDLEWAGIIPDEGPGYGGKYGSYLQSERLDLYHTEVKKLINNGSAYYCFCTERRLELLRKEAQKARQVPKYDNRCRLLTPVQIAERLHKQDPFVIRFKLEPHIDQYEDMVFGRMVYDVTSNEGDPVIVKSDGYPTYHFAHVVDDHHMRTSHVLRGVEWQISTTKHLQLYKAFGWAPPKYGHLPLLINADGTKLSKRQGNINIEHFRGEMGIRPQALINYITLTGGGFDRKQGEKLQIHSMQELTKMFDITKINVSSSRLNPQLLEDCNRQNLVEQLQDPNQAERLIDEVIELIVKTYPEKAKSFDLDREHIRTILNWSTTRIYRLDDLVNIDLLFLWVMPKPSAGQLLKKDVLDELLQLLEKQNDFDRDNLNNVLREFSDEQKLKYKHFMKSMRSILSGLSEGPSVAEMMEILGKQSTLQRIRNNVKL